MRHLDARQVAEQDAMAVKGTLGLAGGAGGVDHHGRVVGRRVDGREGARGLLQRAVEALDAVGRAVDAIFTTRESLFNFLCMTLVMF
ncbi:hypothetical protein VF03_34295 [Nostoc linckia z2]|nr:hypothetical protein VF03_34295 [Nostoc linckia z2]